MSAARFLQIHTLHAYPGALLNRDDSGLAKRLPFGGATRTRISSQCLKRHWRTAEDRFALKEIGVPMGTRSRRTVEDRIVGPAAAETGVDEAKAAAVTKVFLEKLYGDGAADSKSRQAILLGHPEIRFLKEKAAAIFSEAADDKAAGKMAEAFFKEERKNMAALRHSAGLESALFGRMITSDTSSNVEAAIHVAHAFTVHPEQTESDYFTVVDDIIAESRGETGAAGVFDVELTSGLYYGYVVVDVPGLIANLEDDRDIAARVVQHLLNLIATVSPGAKLGSTAPYTYAELMLVETGDRQPRTLANAFRDPVSDAAVRKGGGLMQATTAALAGYLSGLDECYGVFGSRAMASPHAGVALPGSERMPMAALAEWAAERVRIGQA